MTVRLHGCRPASNPKLLAALELAMPFFEPIELPDGRKLVTPNDAARYIQKLPKRPTIYPTGETPWSICCGLPPDRWRG